MSKRLDSAKWNLRQLQSGAETEAELRAVYEVYLDPMSDDFTPAEINAQDLFDRWVAKVRKKHSNGLVPISWYVEFDGGLEVMPFQFEHHALVENFLTHYAWPVDASSGHLLNWLMLPVMDKHWNAKSANKGGFIQEATGWKPSIFQPFVYLPSLTDARRLDVR